MFSLLIEYSAREVRAVETVAGSSRWTRLMRVVVDGYCLRRAITEMHALDDRTLRDLGLDRTGIEHAVRFGRE